MAVWNHRKRVLDSRVSDSFVRLINAQEPELHRDLFPYSEVCRTAFDHKLESMDPPEQMLITDTTFRDGQQARPPYKVEQIVKIYDMLSRLSGPKGIIRQSEFFLYSDTDRKAVEKCQALGHKFPEITGWVRAKKEELKVVKDMGLAESGILTSVSDYHIYYKMNLDRQKALDYYLGVVKDALDLGLVPRCHFEDVTRAEIYGFVIPFARALDELRQESGMPIKIRLCDTMGYGVPYAGASLPRSVAKLVRAVIEDGKCPGELLEWHGHNDFYKVLINASTAWLYGCGAANSTVLGFGERTGNTPLEALVMEYIQLTGQTDGMDTTVITEIAEYFEKEIGYHIHSTTPFVGKDFNSTKAGIHADGLIKNPEIYNIFDTEKILNRPYSIAITDKSGAAGIAHWVNQRLELEGERRLDKRHPGINKIYQWVMEQYEGGRLTSIGNSEMEKAARKHLPKLFMSEFDVLKERGRAMARDLVKELTERKELKTMTPAVIEPVLQEFLDANPYVQFLYVVNAQGYKITKYITHVKDRAKYSKYHLAHDFSDRDWFIEPIENGEMYVSDFYSSVVTKALCITVSSPICDPQDNIIGILGVDIKFEELAKLEAKEDLEG